MTGPNFYNIDFSRDTVLQGKSSTFFTIARNDGVLGTDTLYFIVCPNGRTFDAYSTANIVGTTAGTGTSIDKVEVYGTQSPQVGKMSFNNIGTGMYVKNSQDFMPYGSTGSTSTIGPVSVTEVQTLFTGPSQYLTLVSAPATAGPPVIAGTSTAHFGHWNEDSISHWRINGKSLQEYEYIAYGPPASSSSAVRIYNLPNIFDGTIEAFPSNILEGTGYVGRGVGGWGVIVFDTKMPNASATIRIDYDGIDDAHMKLNLIVFKKALNPANTPLSPVTLTEGFTPFPLSIPKVQPDYGVKTGNGSPSLVVDYQEVHFFGYTQTKNRVSRETWQNNYQSDAKIFDDRSSYSLLRTNPKLSGNVKITLDSVGNLWLNSIDANNELADSSYKKFPITPLSTYARDLYKFFKNGQTPTSIIFSLYQVDDQYQNTKRNLYEQYDNFYSYGVEQLKSRYYDEGFSFFAPLWLRKVVPDFFIIFRLDHPISIEGYKDSTINPKIFQEFFKDARIIKTFDMREKSKLGTYLRKIVNDPRFKERPLDVSFDEDIATSWNGISYANGTMTGKGEFLSDYWKQDRPVIELEEYITGGFERNGIICPNLINLEFLFDDEEATPYSINRYFGLYVTESQLANFEIDPVSLDKIKDQTPLPITGIDGQPYSTKPFVQSNPNGIQIPVHYYHNPTGLVNNTNIPSYQGKVFGKFPLPSFIEDPLRIFYVKDRDDAFKRITTLKEVDYGNPGTDEYRRVTQLGLFDTQEDISKYAGVNQMSSQFTAQLLDAGYSQLRLHLSKNNNDPVFAEEEEIELTFNQYNHDARLHTYYLKCRDCTSSSVSFTVFKDQHTELISAPLSVPAPGFSISLSVVFPKEFIVGDQVFITASGGAVTNLGDPTTGSYFTVSEITGSVLTLINTGNPSNAAQSTPILTTDLISVNGSTFDSVYNTIPGNPNLSIDNLLTVSVNPLLPYVGDETYKIQIKNTEIIVDQIGGSVSADLDGKLARAFQQFRWKMIAKSVALIPGDAWDYPVVDPNGYEYTSTFSNEGTTAQVANALAKCINTFENRPCDALAVEDIIYLKAKRPGLEGNNIEITRRMIEGKSHVYNMSFYEKGNVNISQQIEVLDLPGTSTYQISLQSTRENVIAGITYSYLKIIKTPGGTMIDVRINVNPTTMTSAASTGSYDSYIQLSSTFFADDNVSFIADISALPYYAPQEYVIMETANPLEVKQLFVGGVNRNRNRARLAYGDSERYFNDSRIKVTSITLTGSNSVFVGSLDGIYVGALVSGEGVQPKTHVTKIGLYNEIFVSETFTKYSGEFTALRVKAKPTSPNDLALLKTDVVKVKVGMIISGPGLSYNTRIVSVNSASGIVQINKPITVFGNSLTINFYPERTITFGDLSILNAKLIQDQWYQSQKGLYSPMLGWEVQGKFLYSLPYLEEPVIDKKNKIIDYTNLGEYSIIQLEDSRQEFYQTYDRRIVAYNIYRPIVGIFSIFPIKEFDFDFYFSDYSYTPVLEALRYFFNEKMAVDESLILSSDENYRLTPINEKGITVPASFVINVEGLNPVTKNWEYLDTITAETLASNPEALIINTYYPFYVYDVNEHPRIWSDAISPDPLAIYREGAGLRNYMTRRISVKQTDDTIVETVPLMYRLVLVSSTSSFIKVEKNDYEEDKDLKTFPGFAAITDIYAPDDAQAIRGLLNDGQFIEAFLRQALRSEYDRLRENFNKEYATRSKVVPYINKWVQEGTDARDNYYRLNNSRAFGITNFSPDFNVNFAEPSLLTNEFPYLDTVPKDYPSESLEGSRSYMFAKLSDIAKNDKTWFDLISSNDDDDWFTKYFSLGYPTEINTEGEFVPKNRDERYTFFIYNEGIKRSQTLFRGAKIQVIDYNDQLIPPTEILESTKYNDYKFAAIARIEPLTPYTKEKPFSVDVYRNDKFKSITMIITMRIQDYRVQSGLSDYLFYYAVNDQLKNYNQMQTPLGTYVGSISSFAGQTILSINQFMPYGANTVLNTYENLSVLRPRQGFFGGGYLELGDTRLGGVVNERNPSLLTINDALTLQYKSVDDTYEFSVINEIIPTLDNYTERSNAYTGQTNSPKVTPVSMTVGGSIFKLIDLVKDNLTVLHIDRSNNRKLIDQYLPDKTIFGGTNRPEFSSITESTLITSQLSQKQSNGLNPVNSLSIETIETFNIKGGTSAYAHIKNLLTYASIRSFFNERKEVVSYYKVINNAILPANDFSLNFVAPDQIVKTGVLAYVNDEEKPIEYIGSELMGYNVVNTNQNEVVYRHRGSYEPRANDILSFWVREDQAFTKHFEKDFLLSNSHFNINSTTSGLIRNYGINKVADSEILKIKGGGAYKSVYPLLGEVSVDNKDVFIINSTWDKNFYRKYYDLKSWNSVIGIEEMKEFKSFMGSKVMNIPKAQVLDTFESSEAVYAITAPATAVGVDLLANRETSFTDVTGNTKPILTIDVDIKTRLLRKLYDDILLPTSFDEFTWLTTLGITDFDKLNDTDIERLKKEYLLNNILQLYMIDEIKLYSLSKEGIPVLDLTINDANKISAGYRVDKDCQVVNLDEFKVRITKQLDTKKPYGYSISVTIKRI
jgi:hypothetical protein